MLVTEDEAKTKWCPFVRVALAGGSGSVNRYPNQEALHPEDRCLASGCMMWQMSIVVPMQARRRGTERWESWDWNPGDAERYPDWEFRDRPSNEMRGGCGLAK